MQLFQNLNFGKVGLSARCTHTVSYIDTSGLEPLVSIIEQLIVTFNIILYLCNEKMHKIDSNNTMAYDINSREEELKNRIAHDYFGGYDTRKIIGNVDFCVATRQPEEELFEQESLLWAEAKKGLSDIYKSLVQLILTIGKARTFDSYLPPQMLGAFDAEKIAFIPYNNVHDVFYLNDFNWNVAPSNYETKEFKMVYDKVKESLDQNTLLFYYHKDDGDLRSFIKTNFVAGKQGFTKTRIDKNNFIVIYNKWLQSVKPTIAVNWDILKDMGIIDGDFYLADLLSLENETLKDKLYVLLKKNSYELDRIIDKSGLFNSKRADFIDNQKAHTQFWNKYERPPLEQYWDYIVERRDLLVPQDVRERKGSFFTPQLWVELSQRYLAETLGDDWQDEYYVWDCAAGTGNLLTGLTNKYNIWASTLDKQDVDVMHDRIKNGANLLEDHVFQFDFLNDEFTKLPKPLQEVINNPEKRKKLVIYINPPYAEASNKKTLKTRSEGNRGVEQNKVNKKYATYLGQGNAELFAQFLTRIYFEIDNCIISHFSTLKILNGQHFIDFRNFYKAKLEKCFIIPANTFDNVKGQFPIGFMIWNTSKKQSFKRIKLDVYDKKGKFTANKTITSHLDSDYINDWIKPFRADKNDAGVIGKFPFKGNDFQNQNILQIVHNKMEYNVEAGQFLINKANLIKACVYFAVRKVIPATWLNDRDQFLFPKKKWEKDKEFQNDCLTYTLFTNNIQSSYGTNHWIPFSESEVNAHEKFESDFMYKFISGKLKIEHKADLLKKASVTLSEKLTFSPEAKAVFDAGRALWKYYHTNFSKVQNFGKVEVEYNVNASLYDIREYFQGRNDKGKMNNRSADENYMKQISDLRDKLNLLAQKIEPKVYEHGFLTIDD